MKTAETTPAIVYDGESMAEAVAAVYADAETQLLPCLISDLPSPNTKLAIRNLLADKTRLGTPWATVGYLNNFVQDARTRAGLSYAVYWLMNVGTNVRLTKTQRGGRDG